MLYVSYVCVGDTHILLISFSKHASHSPQIIKFAVPSFFMLSYYYFLTQAAQMSCKAIFIRWTTDEVQLEDNTTGRSLRNQGSQETNNAKFEFLKLLRTFEEMDHFLAAMSIVPLLTYKLYQSPKKPLYEAPLSVIQLNHQ